MEGSWCLLQEAPRLLSKCRQVRWETEYKQRCDVKCLPRCPKYLPSQTMQGGRREWEGAPRAARGQWKGFIFTLRNWFQSTETLRPSQPCRLFFIPFALCSRSPLSLRSGHSALGGGMVHHTYDDLSFLLQRLTGGYDFTNPHFWRPTCKCIFKVSHECVGSCVGQGLTMGWEVKDAVG